MKMNLTWIQGVISSAFIGFLVSGPIASLRGVRDLLGSLVPRRVSWPWYVVALLFGPVLLLAGVGVDLALGGQLPPPPLSQASGELAIVGSAFILLFGSGFTEEPGWRGFALPRMQRRFSPLVTSIILGSLWAFWHASLYFTGFYTATSNTGPSGIVGIMSRFVWVIPMAIIFTWVYNHSRGNLLAMVLMHASINCASAFIPLSARAGLLGLVVFQWVIALLVIISDRMWRKQPSDVPTSPELTEPGPPSREPSEAVLSEPSPSSGEPSAALPEPPRRTR
jgi:membrane protease YdiL (CAAX protease family)